MGCGLFFKKIYSQAETVLNIIMFLITMNVVNKYFLQCTMSGGWQAMRLSDNPTANLKPPNGLWMLECCPSPLFPSSHWMLSPTFSWLWAFVGFWGPLSFLKSICLQGIKVYAYRCSMYISLSFSCSLIVFWLLCRCLKNRLLIFPFRP